MEEDGCCNALNRFRTIAQNVMKMKKEEKESKNKDNSQGHIPYDRTHKRITKQTIYGNITYYPKKNMQKIFI